MEERIRILYEDDDVLVIDKPSGMMVHSDGKSEEETVVTWFLQYYPKAHDVGEEQILKDGTHIERSGVVHRLDKETSGVLILAKTQDAFLHLKAQFHDRLAEKEYRAFVYGRMKEKWGTIERAIGRSTKDFRLRSAQRGAKGTLRPAVTDWECISQSEMHAYLRLMPKTGRTHQLRVHMKAIGRPIVNDTLYAPKNLLQSDNLGIGRLALHAYSLRLVLPNGEQKTFISELPESFSHVAERIAEGE